MKHLKKILAALIISIGLLGCDGDEMQKPENPHGWTVIHWVQEYPETCLGVKGQYSGCAEVSRDGRYCKITMPENSPDYVIAHEVKHCFGYAHTNGRFP